MGIDLPLIGKIALVAGATRGAGRGIARALAEAGAFVYCTGRSAAGSRGMDRPETVEETAELIERAGGQALALRIDHSKQEEVVELAQRVRRERGRLDILINSIWGADPLIDWSRRFWEIDLSNIDRIISQTVSTHLITCRYLAPLMIEANSGFIAEIIDGHFLGYRGHILYDFVKAALARFSYGMAMELADTGVTALAISPGFLRSEAVLEHFGVTETNWRDAILQDPYFAESETPFLIGRALVALSADPKVQEKSGLLLYAADMAREYGFTDVDGRVPDFPQLFDSAVEAMVSGSSMKETDRALVWARYCQIHNDPSRRKLALKLANALELNNKGKAIAPYLVPPDFHHD